MVLIVFRHRALAIVLVVIRSKLVLDFALTVHVLHLVIVTLYSGQLPRNAFWWAAMTVSSALAVALGMWGCRYRELRPISFGGGGGANNNNAANGGGSGNGEGSSAVAGDAGEGGSGSQGDEEQGFSRGRGRGRGRDGAGEYEMVKMNGDAAP